MRHFSTKKPRGNRVVSFVGATGFEPAASYSLSKRSTKLSHAPNCKIYNIPIAEKKKALILEFLYFFANAIIGTMMFAGGAKWMQNNFMII